MDGSAVTPSLNFQLSARHDYLVTRLKSLSYVATPSSIHSLPDDVLYRVLRLLHMASTISPEDLLEWYDNLPSILYTVCLRWQALVLSSPSLWRRIRLNALVDQESIERLHLYLELSRDQPLTIVTESKLLVSFGNQHWTSSAPIPIESTSIQMCQIHIGLGSLVLRLIPST